jgi:hypothetical protein
MRRLPRRERAAANDEAVLVMRLLDRNHRSIDAPGVERGATLEEGRLCHMSMAVTDRLQTHDFVGVKATARRLSGWQS